MEVVDLQNSFYPSMVKGGGLWRREQQKAFRKRWLAAGAPIHYREVYEKGKGTRRVWDLEDRQEHLRDLQDPGRARVRVARGELRLKRREFLQSR